MHFPLKEGGHFVRVSAQQRDEGIHAGQILLRRHFPDARTAAVPDGSGKAVGVFFLSGIRVPAGPEGIIAQEEIECLAQGASVRERAEVETGVILADPGKARTRKVFTAVDADQGHPLVVAEEDVVFGGVFLDQAGLQKKGFILVADRDALPAVDGIHQGPELRIGAVLAGRLEVLGHPPPEVGSLADIDH